MKNTFVTIVVVFLAIFAFILVLSYIKKQNAIEQIIYVGPTDVECEGANPQRCLLVKENPDDDFSLFYDEITGFDFMPGYVYQLLVELKEIENPPADSSSLKYTLVAIQEKQEAPYIAIESPEEFSNITPTESIKVTGSGRGLFEGNVVVEARTLNDEVLSQTITTMSTPELGAKGNWEVMLDMDNPFEGEGRLVSYSPSPKDGETGLIYSIRVTFGTESNSSGSTTKSDIEGVEWQLSQYRDQEGTLIDAIPGGNAFFEQGTINGTTGCNNYFAPYIIDGDKIQIGPAGSTMMACEEPLMEQEFSYLQSLDKATSYKVEGSSAMLMDDNGDVVVEYSQ